MTWLTDAACRPGRSIDPRLFDDRLDGVDESAHGRTARHRKAIEICQACTVAPQCLCEAGPGEGIRAGQLFKYIDIDAPIPYLLTERPAHV